MRRPSPYARERGELDVKMTPMIDVVFLLLVFFVWTASFQIVEYTLPSGVAEQQAGGQPTDAPPPPEADFDQLVVRLESTPQGTRWQLNETPVATLDELEARLRTIARIKADAPLIVHPAANVPIGDVIEAYDRARLAGFRQVQFAASEPI